MSVIITEVKAKIFLELTPEEAMALDAICGYGPEKFLEWFQKNHGKHYIKPWIDYVPGLFDKCRKLEGAVKQYKEAIKNIKRIEV